MMFFQTRRQSAYVAILAMHPYRIPSKLVSQMSCPENQKFAAQTAKSKHVSALRGGRSWMYTLKKFYRKYIIPFLISLSGFQFYDLNSETFLLFSSFYFAITYNFWKKKLLLILGNDAVSVEHSCPKESWQPQIIHGLVQLLCL